MHALYVRILPAVHAVMQYFKLLDPLNKGYSTYPCNRNLEATVAYTRRNLGHFKLPSELSNYNLGAEIARLPGYFCNPDFIM